MFGQLRGLAICVPFSPCSWGLGKADLLSAREQLRTALRPKTSLEVQISGSSPKESPGTVGRIARQGFNGRFLGIDEGRANKQTNSSARLMV